jgi:hypothetical protein
MMKKQFLFGKKECFDILRELKFFIIGNIILVFHEPKGQLNKLLALWSSLWNIDMGNFSEL